MDEKIWLVVTRPKMSNKNAKFLLVANRLYPLTTVCRFSHGPTLCGFEASRIKIPDEQRMFHPKHLGRRARGTFPSLVQASLLQHVTILSTLSTLRKGGGEMIPIQGSAPHRSWNPPGVPRRGHRTAVDGPTHSQNGEGGTAGKGGGGVRC